jgi:probable F420-dependent oxidoreductase
VKLGVNLPNFGPGTTTDSLASWVRFAENAGFDLAMMSDHIAPTPDVAELYPPPFYDPFATLAWMAGITETIKLGTTVTILPYRHPLLVARMAANIDQFSGGRFVLGVGVGWSPLEFEALGVPFRERGAITDDHLAALTAVWAEEQATHHGPYVSFRSVATAPSGVQSPHPPIWVGGASPAAIRRAARFGDAWHPINVDPAWLGGDGLDALNAEAERAGRPRPALAPRIRLRLTDGPLADGDRRTGEGSLSQVLGDLHRFADAGADHLIVDTNPDHPSARRPAAVDQAMLEQVLTAHLKG